MFSFRKHNISLYITLLNLSRNIFFYKDIGLKDSFETRVILMFFHFSIFMIVYKKKGSKLDQESYDSLFHYIENDLRELGYGDVTVNKKMKNLNKILYDILIKMDKKNKDNRSFKLNTELIKDYFDINTENNDVKYAKFETYFSDLFNFCFELSLDNMLKDLTKFKY